MEDIYFKKSIKNNQKLTKEYSKKPLLRMYILIREEFTNQK